jgi:predicted O-methyltransferase YrrM
MKPETVVEIGSSRGYSTCALSLACRENGRGKIYAIDPHVPNIFTEGGSDRASENLEFLLSRLKDYELTPDWCEVIRSKSSEAAREWDKPVDLLFIDGDHSYEGVKGDFEMFRPWLREHSLVAFHDSMWGFRPTRLDGSPHTLGGLGVPRFLDELRQKGYHSVSLNCGPGLTLLCPFVGGVKLLPPLEQLGYDLELMSWGDGSGVPTAGIKSIVVGTDNNGLLHIRIFDAKGNKITDMDETELPATQDGAISILKQKIPGLLPPYDVTGHERTRLVSEVRSIVGQTQQLQATS